jgi:hypothetical protein
MFQTNRRKWLLGLVCLWLTGGWAVPAESLAGVGEYQVKAAFLYNLIKFTDWPTNGFASSEAPMVIGIVGDDPFGQTIDDLVRGETVGIRPLQIKRLKAGEDLSSCHVLFISKSEKDQFPLILNQVKPRPVLTVSDTPGFAEQGGMVTLLLSSKTVKLEINQAVAEDAGLRISAKLLKLARLVKAK